VDAIRNQNPDHIVVAHLDPSVPAVSCDRERVSQVLATLLNNAIKYSPTGSDVLVTSGSNAESVEVSVKDQGPGMPVDFDNGLFVGYRRLHANSVNRVNRGIGSGLGLPIARQIVEMHGGRIWFESAPGHGTEFHFTLPIRVKPSHELKAVARSA
jgi:two-component system clock-associated histidine kinase SasA